MGNTFSHRRVLRPLTPAAPADVFGSIAGGLIGCRNLQNGEFLSRLADNEFINHWSRAGSSRMQPQLRLEHRA